MTSLVDELKNDFDVRTDRLAWKRKLLEREERLQKKADHFKCSVKSCNGKGHPIYDCPRAKRLNSAELFQNMRGRCKRCCYVLSDDHREMTCRRRTTTCRSKACRALNMSHHEFLCPGTKAEFIRLIHAVFEDIPTETHHEETETPTESDLPSGSHSPSKRSKKREEQLEEEHLLDDN